jgi:hypothetical protein
MISFDLTLNRRPSEILWDAEIALLDACSKALIPIAASALLHSYSTTCSFVLASKAVGLFLGSALKNGLNLPEPSLNKAPLLKAYSIHLFALATLLELACAFYFPVAASILALGTGFAAAFLMEPLLSSQKQNQEKSNSDTIFNDIP